MESSKSCTCHTRKTSPFEAQMPPCFPALSSIHAPEEMNADDENDDDDDGDAEYTVSRSRTCLLVTCATAVV